MSKKSALSILRAAAAAFVIAVMALAAWKWNHAAYNGIDLAYFSQALWNTIQGRPFDFSIHPGLTLGDHTEWVLLPLALPYALLPHPLTLVFLQALAIAGSALLVWRIALRIAPPIWALAAGIAFLLLPTSGAMALFEFHALVFALPLILAAADAFIEKRWGRFLLFAGAALLVREDVAFTVFLFGVVALVEKRPLRWWLTPMIASAVWFAAMLLVIQRFSVGGGFKFLAYYGWLWPFDLSTLVRHLINLPQLEFLLVLLMPVFFLPLLKPKWLLLSLPGWLMLALSASGAGAVLASTHYAVLVLPGVVLASLDGLMRAQQAAPLRRWFGAGHARVTAIVLVTAVLFCAGTLGPFVRGTTLALTMTADDAVSRALAAVPADASVAASARFLPHLANRERLYALHYLFLGTTQFAEAPYDPPAPDIIIYDESDLLSWHANFPTLGWTAGRYRPGFARLRALVDRGGYGVVFRDGGITIWRRGAPRPRVVEVTDLHQQTAPGVRTAVINEPAFCPGRADTCPVLVFVPDEMRRDDLIVRLTTPDGAAALMTMGLVPTFDWQKNVPVPVPAAVLSRAAAGSFAVELVEAAGDLTLNALGSAVVAWRIIRPLAPAVTFSLAAPDASDRAPGADR